MFQSCIPALASENPPCITMFYMLLHSKLKTLSLMEACDNPTEAVPNGQPYQGDYYPEDARGAMGNVHCH